METPREFADKIWGTQGFDDNDLRDFNINLNTAIGMIETYCKKKEEESELETCISKIKNKFPKLNFDVGVYSDSNMPYITGYIEHDLISIHKVFNAFSINCTTSINSKRREYKISNLKFEQVEVEIEKWINQI